MKRIGTEGENSRMKSPQPCRVVLVNFGAKKYGAHAAALQTQERLCLWCYTCNVRVCVARVWNPEVFFWLNIVQQKCQNESYFTFCVFIYL